MKQVKLLIFIGLFVGVMSAKTPTMTYVNINLQNLYSLYKDQALAHNPTSVCIETFGCADNSPSTIAPKGKIWGKWTNYTSGYASLKCSNPFGSCQQQPGIALAAIKG